MSVTAIDASRMFQATGSDAVRLWIKLQDIQVDFSIAQEIAAYHESAAWAEAVRVIELGSGTGYHLNRLAMTFPDKSYTALDISEEFVRHATGRYPVFRHICGDARDHVGQYDYCIARLLFQHLTDPDTALAKTRDLLPPRGRLLIIDSDDGVRLFSPAAPVFARFFPDYIASERRQGRYRDVAVRFAEALKTSSDWRLVRDRRITIPSTVADNLRLLRTTYTWFLELVEATGVMGDYDLTDATADWARWCALPDAYTQVGLRVLELERR